jgi:hypothetical protein
MWESGAFWLFHVTADLGMMTWADIEMGQPRILP